LVNEWQGINCDESVDVFIGSKFGTRHLYGTQRKTVIGRTYFLLNHRQIPAVIVEMGVMSNSKDFLMLKDEKTQERISHVLGTAVKLAGKVNSIRIGA
jgi:N-acetylmuramoyl-L-alanine amidase